MIGVKGAWDAMADNVLDSGNVITCFVHVIGTACTFTDLERLCTAPKRLRLLGRGNESMWSVRLTSNSCSGIRTSVINIEPHGVGPQVY